MGCRPATSGQPAEQSHAPTPPEPDHAGPLPTYVFVEREVPEPPDYMATDYVGRPYLDLVDADGTITRIDGVLDGTDDENPTGATAVRALPGGGFRYIRLFDFDTSEIVHI